MPDVWNTKLDKKLLQAKEAGASFAEIGQRLGVSRSAAIGRYHRINGRIFPSQTIEGRAASPNKRAMLERKNRAALDLMDAEMAGGVERNDAMRKAYLNGCRIPAIARHVGLTIPRVRFLVMSR